MSLQRLLLTELKRVNPAGLYWLFPATIGFTWFIWDALDEEWLISLNLATDPEAMNKRVENARLARLEALKKPKPTVLKSPEKNKVVEEVEEEPDEEEDAPAEDKEDAPADDEEESPVEDKEDADDVPAGEDGDDEASAEEEEDEEEEETEVVVKPLYDPIKGKKLGKKEVWDNFTIKALNMSEDDDDDEEEEEEEEDEAEEE